MTTKKNSDKLDTTGEIAELLRDLLIVELVKAGVPGRQIRAAVRCDT